MIVSFRDADTEALASGRGTRRFTNIATVARRTLRQLEIGGRLDDLRVPAGNRLEALKGELLLEEFLVPMRLSQYRLAKELGVPAQRLGEIIAGRRAITADTDLRFCRFFGLSNGY
jgi:addiction module HigA family antidote